MRNRFKNIIIAALVCGMLSLCACKDTDNSSSVNDTQSEAQSVQLELNDVPDDSFDPENVDLGETQGSEVAAQDIERFNDCAYGIDVSKWQGKIDWQAVASDDIDFAIIRIGYRGENGVIYRDANADYNIQQAQKAGLLVGVYFFSTAVSTDEAREEAAFVAEAIKGYKISYPVAYDCEGFLVNTSRMYGLTAAARTNNALAFLKSITEAGYEGMFYGSKFDLEGSGVWDVAQIESSYKMWVAHYPTTTYPQVQKPQYQGRCDMWQYTNRGSVSGVEGNCDMIVSYFVADEKSAVDKNAAPQTATAPKTQEELLYEEVNDQVTAKQEVNLRKGPSTKYDVVGVLYSGEFLTRTGIGKNGWSKLSYNGQTVYAITSYLSNEVIENAKEDIVNGMTFTPASDSVTAKMEVNLRVLPTTDSEVLGKLTSGTFLSRTAISDKGWSRLDYNGTVAYAVTSYLTTDAPEIKPEDTESKEESITEHGMEFKLETVNVTAKEEVNLRDKPTTDGSNVVYTLKNGEYITKTGVSTSGWARLAYNGQTVYAIDSFLMQ